MVLVDTNIVAYLLIDGDYTADAQRLKAADPDWRSEAFLMVEFVNILASSTAVGRMSPPLAERLLRQAEVLLSGRMARLPHQDVLTIAHRYKISAYDARFVALAHRLGRRLVTEDAKLRKAAPNLTQSLAQALET